MHDENAFVTLTYSDANLPAGGSLRPDDFVGFMKRLRWHFGEGIRFFQCGEYGDRLGRPHHHALLFNMRFPDQRFYKEGNGGTLYTSTQLEELWGQGQCSIGEVTFESAGYVARYALKKVKGSAAEAHYAGRLPEYLTMSRRPGIGRSFIDTFRRDVYPADELVVRGVRCRPPRYYDQVQEREAPSVLERIKARRRGQAVKQERALVDQYDYLHAWRYQQEEVKEAAVRNLSRSLEVNT